MHADAIATTHTRNLELSQSIHEQGVLVSKDRLKPNGASGRSRPGPPLQRWTRAMLRRPVRWLWPVTVSNAEHVPSDGAAILCPNHLSFFDSVLMMLTFDRPIYFIGKSEYLDSWKTRRLLPAMGMIPIDRDCGPRAMIALDAAAEVLHSGALLCIYPEGTRSRDGRLYRGYTGAARLAATVGCPIVPVGINGTADIQPPGTRVPRVRQCCSLTIGRPLSAVAGGENRRASARTTTDELMRRIAELTGQVYVPHHAQRVRPVETVPEPSARHLVPALS